MSGAPVKRSVTIAGHRTSISLEADFWDALGEIAAQQSRSISNVIAGIDSGRASDTGEGLSSAVRRFVLAWYRNKPLSR